MSDILDRVKKQSPQPEELPESIQPKKEADVPVISIPETPEVKEPSEETEQTEQAAPDEKEALENSKNPERTKEYIDKLTAEKNEALKKAKDDARKFAAEGPVASLVPDTKQEFDWNKMLVNTPPPASQFPNLTPRQVKGVMADIVDEQGYVNTDLLKETLEKANSESALARQEAQQARREAQQSKRTFDDFQRSTIAKQVHEKYPELNPDSEKFNDGFWETVKNQVLSNTFEGKPEGFLEAADKYADKYVMKKVDKEQQDAIAQINATGTKGSKVAHKPFGEHESLVKAVQQGKKGALGERLKRSGY